MAFGSTMKGECVQQDLGRDGWGARWHIVLGVLRGECEWAP